MTSINIERVVKEVKEALRKEKEWFGDTPIPKNRSPFDYHFGKVEAYGAVISLLIFNTKIKEALYVHDKPGKGD